MSTASIKDQLSRYGLTPNKALGQNFLADDNAAKEIADAACKSGLPVIEIGPGMGALTRELMARAPRVAAVEIDRRMAEILNAELPGLIILNEDALKTDIAALAGELGGAAAIAGNLPYYITTPLCTRFITSGANIPSMTLMMQREAAERFFAKPGDRVYGPMTVLAQYGYDITRLMSLSPSAYYPAPEVDSVVLQFKKRDVPACPGLEGMLEACFRMRRKTLANNLKVVGVSAERLKSVCDKLGIAPEIRAEKLTVEQFAFISRELSI